MGAVTLFLVSMGSSAKALDPIQFGVKVGIQNQAFSMRRASTPNPLSIDNSLGFQMGMLARFKMMGFVLQPEMLYASNRFTLGYMNEPGVARFSLRTLEIPVLLGYKVSFLQFYSGPSFSLMTDTKDVDRHPTRNINTSFTKSTIGLHTGVSAEFKRIMFDLRYVAQFKSPVQTITIDNIQPFDVKTRMNTLQVSVGYVF